MRVVIEGRTVALSDADLVGVGGEASVYRYRDLAIKLYHPVPDGVSRAERKALVDKRMHSIQKAQAFPSGLPAEVVSPKLLVHDTSGATIGFGMQRIDGATEVGRLAQRGYRHGVVSASAVLRLFAHMLRVIKRLHDAHVVVGDFNDGNVLFLGEAPYFIDADSMQFGPYLCPVAHEKFLDPQLYGKALDASACFTEATDFYAYAVMLFASLRYVHPYGGTHPGLPTMLRRAEASVSVFSPGVTLPRAAQSPVGLSDDLADYFISVFEKGSRACIPEALLATHFELCSCGLEHARPRCPGCATAVPVPAPLVSVGAMAMRCMARPMGEIVAVRGEAGLRYVVRHAMRYVREDGSEVPVTSRAGEGTVFLPLAGGTWVCEGPRVHWARQGTILESFSTATFGGASAFSANDQDGYRIEGQWLQSTSEGRRIGKVIPGQTWFAVGDSFGFGFARTGALTHYFVFDCARGGMRPVVWDDIPGRLLDVAATFHSEVVLVSMSMLVGGRVIARVGAFSSDGALLAKSEGAFGSEPLLATTRGMCMRSGAIVVPSVDGIHVYVIDKAAVRFAHRKTFPDAHRCIDAETALLPAPGGALFAVTPKQIDELRVS